MTAAKTKPKPATLAELVIASKGPVASPRAATLVEAQRRRIRDLEQRLESIADILDFYRDGMTKGNAAAMFTEIKNALDLPEEEEEDA
jgi:hypothetical protein